MPDWQRTIKDAAAFLGKPIRLPGWAAMLLAAYSFIPDTESRLEFWLGLKMPPVIAALLASPWAGVILFLIGVSYLWFFRGVVHVHHHHATVHLQGVGATGVAAGFAGVESSNPPLPLVTSQYSGDEATTMIYGADVAATLREEMPIYEVIAYVARRLGDAVQKENDFAHITRKALRQAALDGKLHLRGRKQLKESSRTIFSDVLSNIPQDYWADTILSYLTVEPGHSGDIHTFPEAASAWNLRTPNHYTDIVANRLEVVRLWP